MDTCPICKKQKDAAQMYDETMCVECEHDERASELYAPNTPTPGWREAVPKIGDRVFATMNGIDWIPGIYEKESEIFAQYGVRVDGGSEVRYFITIKTALSQGEKERG